MLRAAKPRCRVVFVDRLNAALSLTIGNQTFAVVAGNIKRFQIDIASWGFTAEAEWWSVSQTSQIEDLLFASFMTNDLATVVMTIKRTFDEVDEAATPMTLTGLVMDKSVTERTTPSVANAPVLQRRYNIRFADRASVLWRQHYPNALYVDKTIKDLIEDNKPTGLTMTYTWAPGDVTHPVLSLGLGAAENDASFYDFMFWLAHARCGGLYYDTASDSYSLVDAKPTADTPMSADIAEVAALSAVFPARSRSTVSVLNAFTDAATAKTSIPNTESVTGVRKEFLIRSSVSSDMDDRVALETLRARQPAPEVRLTLQRYPALAYKPSTRVTFDTVFSANIFQHGNTYRVMTMRIAAMAESPEAGDDTDEPSNRYKMDYEVALEVDSDTAFRYPEFKTPRWPFHVEGKVLSETGQEADGTYQSYQDQTTSLDFYKVKIPLWRDAKVIVSYEPNLLTGHFYFPVYRDARVLIALEFDRGGIAAFLDWRPGARLPLDSQGNQILVGKSAKNQTSISHAYEDAKPELTILRTMDTDTQTIKISEGTIRFETKDDGGS